MPFVNQRWLGGMLTNFQTVSGRVKRMQELRTMQAAGDFEGMPKREALSHSRELEKLSRNLSGIANLERLPNAVFVIDTKKEHIAVTEARKLGLPVVAVVDTNCDPDIIDYVIPGNDDAIRSGSLMCRVLADAVVEGRFIAEHRRKNAPPAAEEVNTGPSPRARRVPPPPAPAPAETAPAETAPAETAPAETAPAETAPAETAQTETAQTETPVAPEASIDAPTAEAELAEVTTGAEA
jgi:small subunit ribosomal protein S2